MNRDFWDVKKSFKNSGLRNIKCSNGIITGC